jgi:hypothetical protein
MTIRTFLVGAALASAFAVAPAYADDLVFQLDNKSSSDITEFHVSVLSSDSWEENILTEPIKAGETATVTLSNADGRCKFDLRTVYDDGSTTDERAIDLCSLDDNTYTVTD